MHSKSPEAGRTNQREQDKLLDAYLQSGLISKRNFLQEPAIAQAYNEAKALFV